MGRHMDSLATFTKPYATSSTDMAGRPSCCRQLRLSLCTGGKEAERAHRKVFVDLAGELVEGLGRRRLVQRLLLVLAEYLGKVVDHDAAEEQIGVRDGQQAVPAVANRACRRKALVSEATE